MRVLEEDAKAGRIKLLIENLDDLWHLYNIIEKGDLASTLTYRRTEVAKDKIRTERAEKKRMHLSIRVEKVEFHEFSDRLRVHGIIEQGIQDIGSYHTFNLTVGDFITIVKEEWKEHHLNQIREAVKSARMPLITLLAIEDDEATFAILRQYGVQEIARITVNIPGKQYTVKKGGKKEFYGEVLEKLRGISKGTPLIILGPGFAKEEFYAFGKEKEPRLFERALIKATGQGGMAGVQELLKRGSISDVLVESRVAYETELVEKLLEEIAREGLYAYGVKDVENALNLGAVEKLLVTDQAIRDKRAENALKLSKDVDTKVVIVSTVHDAGKKLESLGGLGALLRYKIGNYSSSNVT